MIRSNVPHRIWTGDLADQHNSYLGCRTAYRAAQDQQRPHLIKADTGITRGEQRQEVYVLLSEHT